MMRTVISIGSDRSLFEEGSPARERIKQQGTRFKELHVIVFSRRALGLTRVSLSQNVWLYPTNSSSRFSYVRNAVSIGSEISRSRQFDAANTVVSAQDPFESGLAAKRLASRFNFKLHLQIHTDFLSPYFRKSSFLNRIRVFLAKRNLPIADAVRVVSKKIADSIESAHIKLKRAPLVLPVFVDVEKIVNGAVNFDVHKKYPDWQFIVLMASRLAPEKDIYSALRAMKMVVKKYPRTGLVIVGEGNLRAGLSLHATGLGLHKNVVFEGWQKDMVSYYRTANAFLNTSLFEGYGMSMVEAAAAGCPIVSTDVGVARELLTGEYAQFICAVGDVRAFASGLLKLIENNVLRERFSGALAESTLPISKNFNEYLEQYERTIEMCFV